MAPRSMASWAKARAASKVSFATVLDTLELDQVDVSAPAPAPTGAADDGPSVLVERLNTAFRVPAKSEASPWQLPGQPTRPRAVHISETSVEIEWNVLDGGGEVNGHRVRMQVGGDGGFVVAVEDTKSAATRAVLQGLDSGMWYEFDVATLNENGVSAYSRPTRPVQTLVPVAAPAPAAAPAPTPEDEVQTRVMLEYEKVRRQLLRWDDEFVATHGRPATQDEHRESRFYARLFARYKQLKREWQRGGGARGGEAAKGYEGSEADEARRFQTEARMAYQKRLIDQSLSLEVHPHIVVKVAVLARPWLASTGSSVCI